MSYKSDTIFRQLALRYTEYEGHGYLRELAAERAAGSNLILRGSGSYRSIKAKINAPRIKVYQRIGAIAASFVAVLLIATVLFVILSDINSPSEFQAIPLNFSLPAGFSASEPEVDRTITTYYLQHTDGDSVVIMLERDAPLVTDGLTRLTVQGYGTVWVRSTADYKLMTFKHEGILYTLTCRHDMETLVRIYKSVYSGG